ncbi:hypothetical protein [Sessilibacter corallicola]|uniref:hypothetical protein n=1 Tax=Sessilibacter corallicola TaxID=2904075 RepID=UPI001E325775|nr:hypothetical protein [Sessilibacter corallicola]MCE2029718.1 hypothetical protein [Sessilibacter corallicola]
MKYLLIFSLFLSASLLAETSPENAVQQLWQSLSSDPQQKPNITKLKELLHPNAVIYGASTKNDSPELKIWSANDFVQMLDKKSETGFYECEVARKMQIYDRFAHVYSVVESRYRRDQIDPDFVGVNSIQLYLAGDKWQILSIYYQVENPNIPVPLLHGKTGVCLS